MKSHIPNFLSNLSSISFYSAKLVLLVIHCCQNEQLQRNHQLSGKTFPPTLIQWLYARLFAPSVGHESVVGGKMDSWSCQLWKALLGKYQNSEQKASEQTTLLVQKVDWLNMVALLMKFVSFQKLRVFFILPSLLLREDSCYAIWKTWAETFCVTL